LIQPYTAIWKSSDISYATVSPGIKRWQGIVTKVKAGIILIIASSPGVVPDTVVVTLLTPHIIDTPSIAPADNKPGCGCGSERGWHSFRLLVLRPSHGGIGRKR